MRDSLGNDREDFPMTCYIVAGTQAEHAHTNNIVVMKMSNLTAVSKPKNDDEDSDSSSEDDDSSDEKDKEPVLDAALIKHPGTVNRIRVRVRLSCRNFLMTCRSAGCNPRFPTTVVVTAGIACAVYGRLSKCFGMRSQWLVSDRPMINILYVRTVFYERIWKSIQIRSHC